MSKEHSTISDEFKEQSIKGPTSKFEHDLFDEDKNIAHPIVRVKKFGQPDKNENWRIYENNKVVFIVEGSKLSKKEKNFLYTIEGIKWLISSYKETTTSFNNFKKCLKQQIK